MKLWPPIRSKPLSIQREFKGVNKLDPFSIAPTYATDMKNLSSGEYPSLSVRPGVTQLGTIFNSRVLGLLVWKDTELHGVFAGKWYKWTGNAWTQLVDSLVTTHEWSYANFKGNLPGISLIASNGVNPIKVYDGNTVQDLATAPAGGNYIEQYADRLYCAVGNDLRFSAYRMANDWTTVNGDDADSGYITIETPNGETINGLKASFNHVTIFKPSSMHELYGSSASDYRVIPVTYEIGALSNKCIANLGGVLYFLDDTGIYQYNGGTVPSKAFSLPVQSYIDRINQTAKANSCVGTDGRKLYVSIPEKSFGSTDTILEYDPLYGIWSVWKDFTAQAFAKMGNALYHSDASGRVNQHGGSTDNGIAINWHWVSKPFGSGSLAQRIRWNRMWIVANVPAGSSLNVYLSKKDAGDDDWTLVQSVTAAATLESTRIIIPTSIVANANWIRVKFSGSGPCEIKEFARDEMQMPIV